MPVDQILDEVVPSSAGPRADATPSLAPAPAPNRSPAAARGARRGGLAGARTATKPAVVRRRYAEYAEEYRYVWSDLQRILVVAGLLVALLIVLWFFID